MEGKGGIPFRFVDLIATQQPSNIAMIHEVGQWQWHFKDNTSKVCSHVEDKKSTERKNMGTKSVKPKETRLLFVALLYIFAMFLKQKNWEKKQRNNVIFLTLVIQTNSNKFLEEQIDQLLVFP